MRGHRKRRIIISLIFLAVTVAVTSPVAFRANSLIPGDGGDASLFVWNLWWMNHALTERYCNPFFCDEIFHPIGASLVFHTFTPLYGFLSIPIQAITSAVVAYNLIFLLTYFLTGMLTYVLARKLGLGTPAAVGAGLLFMIAPVRAVRSLGHLNLLSTFWWPLFLIVMLRIRKDGRFRVSLFLALIAAGTVLCSYQIAVMLFLIAGVWSVSIMADEGRSWLQVRWKHSSLESEAESLPQLQTSGRGLVRLLILLATVPLLSLLILSPLLLSMEHEFRWEGNYVKEDVTIEGFPSDITYYFTPFFPSFTARFLEHYFPIRFDRGTEQIFSPGYGTYLLFLIGIFAFPALREYRLWWWILLLLLIIFFVLSLGSFLRISGAATTFELPFKYVRELPILSGMRVPSRYALGVALFMSLFAGVGINKLLAKKRWWSRAFLAVCAVLIFGDGFSAGLPSQDITKPPLINLEKLPWKRLQIIDSATTPSDAKLQDQEETGAGKSASRVIERVMNIPFGIESGFRPVGMDVARTYLLEQVLRPRRMMSGMVARSPNETLSYFYDNPWLRRINELQSGEKLTNQIISEELMRKIAANWLTMGEFDAILLHRGKVGPVRITQRKFNDLAMFVKNTTAHQNLMPSSRGYLFLFSRLKPFPELFDFRHHAENDCYIYTPVLPDGTMKYVDREFLRATTTLRLVIPIHATDRSRTMTIRYRGFVRNQLEKMHLVLSLNRHILAQLPYQDEWSDFSFELPHKAIRDGMNVLQIDYREQQPETNSPPSADNVVPISIVSAGYNCDGVVDARILVNGKDQSENLRGLNVVTIDPRTGSVLARKSFDTCGSRDDTASFVSFVRQLKPGTIVALAVKDDASVSWSQDFDAAIRSLGGEVSLHKKFRAAYALIGVKGAPSGTVPEKLDDKLAVISAGNGEFAVEWLSLDGTHDADSIQSVQSAVEAGGNSRQNQLPATSESKTDTRGEGTE